MKSKKNLRKQNKCWKDFQKYWERLSERLFRNTGNYRRQISFTKLSIPGSLVPLSVLRKTKINIARFPFFPRWSLVQTSTILVFLWFHKILLVEHSKKEHITICWKKSKAFKKAIANFFSFKIFSFPYPEEREGHMHTHITQQPSTESEASEVCPASHRTTAKIPAWSSSHQWAATDDSQIAKSGKPRPWAIKHLQFS